MMLIIIVLLLIALYISFNKYSKEKDKLNEAIKIAQELHREVIELREVKNFNTKLVGAVTDTMYKNSPLIRLEMAEAVIDGSYKVKDFYPEF